MRGGVFIEKTSIEEAKEWLNKIKTEIIAIDKELFAEIIDKLLSSDNIIASSLGILLTHYSNITPTILTHQIDKPNWLLYNLPYLLDCLDNLPLNKLDLITKGIESGKEGLISLALNQITSEFTCEEILDLFKKCIIVFNNQSNKENRTFSRAVAFGFSYLDNVSKYFKDKWLEMSKKFVNKKDGCFNAFKNWIDDIIKLDIDIYHLMWWYHFDINIKLELLEWSKESETRDKFTRLLYYEIYIYYFTRNWYRNPSVWKFLLQIDTH